MVILAFLKPAKTEDEVKKMTVREAKTEYNKLAKDYNHLLDLDYIYCPGDNEFISRQNFYKSKKNASGFDCYCKACRMKQACDYDPKEKIYRDNRDKTIQVLKELDLPFKSNTYNTLLSSALNDTKERSYQTAFSRYMTVVSSLPQYQNKTFKDSDFGIEGSEDTDFIEDTRKNQKIIKNGKQRFGSAYTNEELYWLENEYQDWIARYPCDSKSQEVLFKRLCCQELEADKAQKSGRSTKDLDKTIQETMSSLGIKPSQSNADALADNLTFGQLIDKWEQEQPIPEPSDEFKDVDKIGTYIDVFFKGHLTKMMGLRNALSSAYDSFMKKYTVNKPDIDDEEEEALFNQIFGSRHEED